MFRNLFFICCLAILVFVGSGTGTASADEGTAASAGAHRVYSYEPGGELDNCIQFFYDPDMYNWYSMRNTCSFRIHWTSVNPGGSGDIRPGGKASNGQTRTEMSRYSDTEFVFCREGYIPVDDDGNYWRGGPYRCRK